MTTQTQKKIPTIKILVWLILVTVVMIFAGLTSGYIVRQAEGNWVTFQLPFAFYISTAIILASKATYLWAQISLKRNHLKNLNSGLIFTLILGIGFCISQFYAWSELVKMGIFFTGNPSGSFLYVLTALHLLHLLGGLILLIYVTVKSLKKMYTPDNHIGIDVCGTVWYFLGFLWIYLIVFLALLR